MSLDVLACTLKPQTFELRNGRIFSTRMLSTIKVSTFPHLRFAEILEHPRDETVPVKGQIEVFL